MGSSRRLLAYVSQAYEPNRDMSIAAEAETTRQDEIHFQRRKQTKARRKFNKSGGSCYIKDRGFNASQHRLWGDSHTVGFLAHALSNVILDTTAYIAYLFNILTQRVCFKSMIQQSSLKTLWSAYVAAVAFPASSRLPGLGIPCLSLFPLC